jgi:hypothetical protein
MKKIMLVSSLVLFMASCETDSVENTNQNVIGYKYTTESNYDDPGQSDYKIVNTGNLFNGKLFSETAETFVNGVSQGSSTEQNFFYSNDLLSMRKGGTMDIYYFYDTNGDLTGATGVLPGTLISSGGIYERYVQQPNNIVYCERVDLPYNNPNAMIYSRNILQRNSDGEVIAAGRDADLNGVMDSQHMYTYVNGNMTSLQRPDGTVITFNYSSVVDTYSYLQELSCGKQVLQFPCAQTYALGHVSGLLSLKYSKNVTSDDLLLQNYQVLPSNFYFKRNLSETMVGPIQGVRTTEMEYFFN